MNDQVTETQVEQPAVSVDASEVEKVSAPEQNAETTSQETEGGEEKQTQEDEKTFTQKELDEIIQKRIRKAERVAEQRALKAYSEKLEAMQKPREPEPAKSPYGKPTSAQFGENIEAYVEAVAEWTVKQKELENTRREIALQDAERNRQADKLYSEAEKIPGFDVDAFESSLTPAIAGVIMTSKIAPKLMAYIASHPEDIAHIADLHPARQAAEISKLEDKLSDTKKVANTSKAPAPMKPVGSKGGQVHKPVAEMSLAELRKFEETRGSKFI